MEALLHTHIHEPSFSFRATTIFINIVEREKSGYVRGKEGTDVAAVALRRRERLCRLVLVEE